MQIALWIRNPRTVNGQSLPKRARAEVRLALTAPDDMENAARSYISRELRLLPDVQVVSDDANWVLEVLMMNSDLVDGQRVGVIASVVVYKPFDGKFLAQLTAASLSLNKEDKQDLRERIVLLTSGNVVIKNHMVYSYSDEALRSLCEKIVADFDGGQLEPYRQRVTEFMGSANQ